MNLPDAASGAEIAALVLVVAAAAWDVGLRRIPNALTYPVAVIAMAWAVLPTGLDVLAALAGGGVALAATFPLFARGALGGGDVKLVVVLGLLLGAVPVALSLFWTLVIAASAMAVLRAVTWLRPAGIGAGAEESPASPTAVTSMALGPAIAGGVCLTVVFF